VDKEDYLARTFYFLIEQLIEEYTEATKVTEHGAII
jgi:hypothetical protein